MEYTWRITAESLTVRATIAATLPSVLKIDLCAQLLDDDDEVVGRLHSDCSFIKGRPVPTLQPGKGTDFIELEKLPSDELLEVIGMWLHAHLVASGRADRMFSDIPPRQHTT